MTTLVPRPLPTHHARVAISHRRLTRWEGGDPLLNVELTWREHQLTLFARLPARTLDAAEVGTLVTRLASAWSHVWMPRQAISCRVSCSACCRQMVPVSEPEMHQLRATVSSLPPEDRQRIEARFHDRLAMLEAAGLAERLRSPPEDDEGYAALMLDYFRAGVTCPFLEDNRCSIYEERPSICREYAVSTPPDWCDAPFSSGVQVVPTGLRMVQLAQQAWTKLGHPPLKVTALPLAFEWLEREGEPWPRVDGTRFIRTMFESAPRTLRPWIRAMPSSKPPPDRPLVEVYRGAS